MNDSQTSKQEKKNRLQVSLSSFSDTIKSKLHDTHMKPPSGAAVDLSQLCVKEGRKCWALYLDALLLSRDGNVVDACSIAFKVGGVEDGEYG